MYEIIRNQTTYGPYSPQAILTYVNSGKLLMQDKAKSVGSTEIITVEEVLRREGMKANIEHNGNLTNQLNSIGKTLIFPKDTIVNRSWLQDKRLMMLAIIGLLPSFLMFVAFGQFLKFYLIALYFSGIWGLFFYYFFKTHQVSVRATITVFFMTQIFVFLIWDILGLPNFNPFYHFTDSIFPISWVGYVLGVGLTEEFGKAIPLLILEKKAKSPLIPQTMVYYGLMSGIAFGVFEGVQYQMGVNAQLEYADSFFMNIARLTSLPFLHAIWCAIAGYFIAFANLYPRYRKSMYFLALAIPAVLHGTYDTFCGNALFSIAVALPTTVISVILLMTYLKEGTQYQSVLKQ